MTLPRSGLLTVVAAAVAALGFLNFVWFFAESSTIGDAGRGFIRDGHYFLVQAGRATEVSREAFDWSLVHGRSLLITHPLAMIAGAYLLFTVGFPSMLGASARPEDRLRVDRITGSGAVLASERTGGQLGELRLTRPLIRIEVRPAGVLITPFGMEPIGIDADRIDRLMPERSRLYGSGIVIAHRQAGVPRIRLLLEPGDPLATAIEAVATGSDGGNPDDRPSVPLGRSVEPYSRQMKAMVLGGFTLSLVFAFVAIPFGARLGTFGLIWSVGLIAILCYNAWWWFIRNRDRW